MGEARSKRGTSMRIYLMRHSDAEEARPGEEDAERRLTAEGTQQAENAAKWLKAHGIKVEAVVSSPLVRARQTAEPVARELKVPICTDARLAGGRLTLSALTGIVRDMGDPASILLVGHEPDMSLTVEELTGGRVDFKKGALALVKCDQIANGEGELCWLIPPKLQR
jgi:phosphohistidine phosphatase